VTAASQSFALKIEPVTERQRGDAGALIVETYSLPQQAVWHPLANARVSVLTGFALKV